MNAMGSGRVSMDNSQSPNENGKYESSARELSVSAITAACVYQASR